MAYHFLKAVLVIFLLALSVGIILNLLWITHRPEIGVQLVDYFGFPPVYAADITCPTESCNSFPEGFADTNQDLCSGKDVFLLILVTSSPENWRHREAIRNSWGSMRNKKSLQMVLAFVVGLPSAHKCLHSYDAEMTKHKDLIISNVTETYRNLTAKTGSLLLWASRYCSHAKYIMKTDDDSFNVPQHIARYLQDKDPTKDLLIGECASGIQPYRDLSSKWYVSKEEYPGHYFPLYTRGRGYIMTQHAVNKLLKAAHQVIFNPMEDVFWTGFARWKAGVNVDCSRHFAVTNENEIVPRCTVIQRDLFNIHHVKVGQFELYWRWFQEAQLHAGNGQEKILCDQKSQSPRTVHGLLALVVLVFITILCVVRGKIRNKK